MKLLRQLALGIGILAFAFTARAGYILDAGHYHGFYGGPFYTSLVGSAKANSTAPGAPVLFIGGNPSLTVPHVLDSTLTGHVLSTYSAIWFAEGWSGAVAGFEGALAAYAASGRWVGWEGLYYSGSGAPLTPILGFNPDALFSFASGCGDGGPTTAAGIAFGLTASPDPIGCREHNTWGPGSFPAGWVSFHDTVATPGGHSTIMALGAVVPAPGSLALLGLGLLLIAGGAVRKRA